MSGSLPIACGSGPRLPAAMVAALLVLALPATALGCEPRLQGPNVQRIDGKRYALAWRARPAIQVSEFFTLDVAVCSRDGQPRVATLRVDAVMPDHGHGMNYRASVRPRGPDRFVVEGLLWHMPGRWELRFDVNAGADRESLAAEVTLD